MSSIIKSIGLFFNTISASTLSSAAKRKEIDTVFELNPGNHFQDAAERSAAGMAWILSR